MFKKFGCSEKSFTLIELLVVIAIIGILASIVFVNANSVRQKARDARALADFRQIEMAARMDYDQCGNWAIDTCPGEPPRFSNPNYWGCAGEQNNYDCPSAQILYSVNDFNAESYCRGCTYDWENWSGGPDPSEDCIIIDIRDPDWYVIKARCISTDGCPDYDCENPNF